MKIRNFDTFALVNIFFFLIMCYLVYYDRFISYRGLANIHEFFFYATVIISVIIIAWYKFRYLHVRLGLLVLIEIGILMHFSGAFIEVDGHRLYDSRFFDIRYDKFVHFTNALISTFITLHIFSKRGIKDSNFTLLLAVLTVLGLGAVVEMVEYVVTLTVEHNGVGAYNNNMLDLVANFFGSIFAVILYKYKLKDLINPQINKS